MLRWIKKENNKEDFLFINQKWGFELKKSFIDFDLYIQGTRKSEYYPFDDFCYPTALSL